MAPAERGRRRRGRALRLSPGALDRPRPLAGGLRRRRRHAGQPAARAQPHRHPRRPLPGSAPRRRRAGAAGAVGMGGGRLRAGDPDQGARRVRTARAGGAPARGAGRWVADGPGTACRPARGRGDPRGDRGTVGARRAVHRLRQPVRARPAHHVVRPGSLAVRWPGQQRERAVAVAEQRRTDPLPARRHQRGRRRRGAHHQALGLLPRCDEPGAHRGRGHRPGVRRLAMGSSP
jgi:hypothetical protein